MNLATYRRARLIYHALPPRERVGITPEALAARVVEAAPQTQGMI